MCPTHGCQERHFVAVDEDLPPFHHERQWVGRVHCLDELEGGRSNQLQTFVLDHLSREEEVGRCKGGSVLPPQTGLQAPGDLHAPVRGDLPEPVRRRRDCLGQLGLDCILIVQVCEIGVQQLLVSASPLVLDLWVRC